MNLTQDELISLIEELIHFSDKKELSGEKTTKGAGELNYKIYFNSKSKYMYKNFIIKGSMGSGNLSSDVGIAFLKDNNRINSGVYIYMTYNYKNKTVYLSLGTSYENEAEYCLIKKTNFNEKYSHLFCKEFDYNKIINKLDILLDKFDMEIL